MNFQQLEYVLAVHAQKHFGNAAYSCDITQATLSAMIKKLEEELGFLLFDRKRTPIQTTDLGLQFMPLAEKVLTLRNDMINLNSEKLAELEGDLIIGVIPTIANSLLPVILPVILEKNPKLKLTITEITTEEIIRQLLTDKIDLGILATPLEDESLEETILYYEAMMVYGVKGEQKRYVSTKDIRDRKVWLLEEGNCFRDQSLTVCNIQEKQQENSNLIFEGRSFDTLLNMTDQFGGITLVPELYFNQLPDFKKEQTKSFSPPIPVREISIVSHRTVSKQQTIDYLEALIKELVEPLLSTMKYKAKDLEIIGI